MDVNERFLSVSTYKGGIKLFELQLERMVIVAIKLILALVCGGVLGIDRGRKKRPAGFRTYMLVCMGATLAMMTNQYICDVYQTGDPSRLGAQVISGIGFLGAGTIMTTAHSKVKGLTTAAGLWAAGCIGLAIGIGFYEGAILGTVMIFVAMAALHKLDGRIVGSSKVISAYVELENMASVRNLSQFLKEKDVKLLDIETESSEKLGKTVATVTLRVPNQKMLSIIIYMINAVDGVIQAEEI